jgi:tocopherol cyclase
MSEFFTTQTAHSPLPFSSYEIKKIWNPTWFQGSREKKQYFEGWYFKNVTKDGNHCWSFIPGVSLVGKDAHSFVQAINGRTGETYYFNYPLNEFQFSKNGFNVKVGPNSFSLNGFELDINDGQNRFKGKVKIHHPVLYPVKLSRPGIMGWYRYVPFMECYHGVVSLDHQLSGNLDINGESIIWEGGRGYIEKDWGSSMPKSWIWMQTNHFEQESTSFMLSVARIPWIGKTFTGFLGFILYKGKIISFATYTGARILKLDYSDRETRIEIKAGSHIINIHGVQSDIKKGKPEKGSLKAPVLGSMDRVIHESIDAEINLQIRKSDGKIIFEGKGINSGLEMVGDLNLLKD